jgi:hypothetical protein
MGKGFSKFSDNLKDIGTALWYSAIAVCIVMIIVVMFKLYKTFLSDPVPMSYYPQQYQLPPPQQQFYPPINR